MYKDNNKWQNSICTDTICSSYVRQINSEKYTLTIFHKASLHHPEKRQTTDQQRESQSSAGVTLNVEVKSAIKHRHSRKHAHVTLTHVNTQWRSHDAALTRWLFVSLSMVCTLTSLTCLNGNLTAQHTAKPSTNVFARPFSVRHETSSVCPSTTSLSHCPTSNSQTGSALLTFRLLSFHPLVVPPSWSLRLLY